MPAEGTASQYGFVVPPGRGQTIEGIGVQLKATAETTGGSVAVMEVVNPGRGGPPLHVHHAHDEMFYVLEGEYIFQIGTETTRAEQGAFAWAPRGTAHTFASTGEIPYSRLLIVNLPGGLEHFVAGLARLLQHSDGTSQLDALNREWNTETVGPPLYVD